MRMFERFFKQPPTVRFAVQADGGPRVLRMLECTGRDFVAKQVASSGWQSFEPPMPDIFFAACRENGGLVLDVGANTGFYALLAAAARRDTRIIALEPAPQVKPLLDQNISINGFRRRITAMPIALSDHPGACDLFIPLQDHGLVETSASLERTFKQSHSDVIRVETDTIDGLLGKHASRRLPAVSIIKIDVEGHEAAVIRGGAKTIRQHRPLLFVEVLPRADLEGLNAFLRDNSYRDLPLKLSDDKNTGDAVAFDPNAWNHLFIPAERAADMHWVN
jgi:FkbM family methyltransferase